MKVMMKTTSLTGGTRQPQKCKIIPAHLYKALKALPGASHAPYMLRQLMLQAFRLHRGDRLSFASLSA